MCQWQGWPPALLSSLLSVAPAEASARRSSFPVRDAGQDLSFTGVARLERSEVHGYEHQFGAVNVRIHELDTIAGHLADDCFAVEEVEVITYPDRARRDRPGQVEAGSTAGG